MHVDEECQPSALSDLEWQYTCERTSHPNGKPFSWSHVEPPPATLGTDGIAAELGLDVELPNAVAQFRGQWVEYGVVEHTYAMANPDDFARLVDRFGHRILGASAYSSSAFIARCLGALGRTGSVAYHDGPATGIWSPLGRVSWWTIDAATTWGGGLSVSDAGLSDDYVPRKP